MRLISFDKHLYFNNFLQISEQKKTKIIETTLNS